MKKMAKACFALLVTTLALLIMSGCESQVSNSKGTMLISIGESLSRAIVPNVSMDVSYYYVEGKGPNNNMFTMRIDAVEPTATKSNLICGQWTIKATAYNSSDIAIGGGTATETIVPNTTTTVSIEITENVGEGVISFLINGVNNETTVFTAHIFKNSKGVLNECASSVFEPAEDGLKAVFSLTNGFYYIKITTDDEYIQMPSPEAFRIVAGDNLSASYRVFLLNGSASVLIRNTIARTPSVSISKDRNTVVTGDTVNATASCTDISASSYAWFLNGSQIEGASDSVSFLIDKAGDYKLSCIVTDDSSVIWSDEISFTALLASSLKMPVNFYNGDMLIETKNISPYSDSSMPILEQNGELAFAGWHITGTDVNLKPSAVMSLPYSEEGYRAEAVWKDLKDYFTVSSDGTLTKIGNGLSNSNVEKLIFPGTLNGKAVKTIGLEAFKYSGIKSIRLPEGVTSIGTSAFYGCGGLTEIVIPASVKTIGTDAFRLCSGLTEINIPNSVTKIDFCAFYGCSGITDLIIPNSVTTIGEYAFEDCTGLTSVKLSNSLTELSDRTFNGCRNLTSVTIPDSVTKIKNMVFYDCVNLASVTIPSSVTYIGEDAFYNCDGLTSINLPENVKYIGQDAFGDCDGLTDITLPASVTFIGESVFSHCNSLESVNIQGQVTSIGDYAFAHCLALTNITIPASIKLIGEQAFRNCPSLSQIQINKAKGSVLDAPWGGDTVVINSVSQKKSFTIIWSDGTEEF